MEELDYKRREWLDMLSAPFRYFLTNTTSFIAMAPRAAISMDAIFYPRIRRGICAMLRGPYYFSMPLGPDMHMQEDEATRQSTPEA